MLALSNCIVLDSSLFEILDSVGAGADPLAGMIKRRDSRLALPDRVSWFTVSARPSSPAANAKRRVSLPTR